MEFKLTDDQRAMVAAVRAVVQERIKPRAATVMDGSFPHESFRDLAGIGILGMAVPQECGSLGLPVFETALVIEEIASHDLV